MATSQKLVYEPGPHIIDDEKTHVEADFLFPQTADLSWNKHIVGAVHHPSGSLSGLNYILSDGSVSNLPYKVFSKQSAKEVRIPEGAVIQKVKMFGWEEGELYGLQFFDKDGNKILEAGYIG